MFLFLVLINEAGFKDEDRNMGERLTKAVNARKAIKNLHLKYVDDLTLAEAIKLKSVLVVENNSGLERPLEYHKRTEQTLKPEDSQVQEQLNELTAYAEQNEMKINQEKSKVMLFNV